MYVLCRYGWMDGSMDMAESLGVGLVLFCYVVGVMGNVWF